ncbi:hypothetical protein VP1G_05977 [Cytospora mali]|uniref:Uncharacterized protein n=1 Tax=Cytospora mali TaxID=578113 RepID=A0A194V457_CYTMA|nr:hypothetical protein VP1G_05977 [Valsa mali var. pyri (nom. inval.)]
MSAYKRVENRKYNEDEINYVISRAQAGWDNDTIAKAFKRDFAQYWGGREFTKKQVAYIRVSYKVPWGVVETYKGPVPQFTGSPALDAIPGPSSSAQQKGKQVFRPSEASSSPAQVSALDTVNNFIPMTSAQYEQAQPFGGVTAGPTGHGQNMASSLPSMANNTGDMGGNFYLQPPANPSSTSVGDHSGIDTSGTRMTRGNVDIDSFDFFAADFFDPGRPIPELSKANSTTAAPQNLGAGHADLEAMHSGQHGATQQGATQQADLNNLFANTPIQSVEQQQQPDIAAAQGIQASTGNATNFDMPSHQQPDQAAQTVPHTGFPPGYTAANAAVRDDHGVWYYDPHDNCRIALGHRHDMNGGVHFSGSLSLAQSFAAMHRTEGIGFLLGLAAAQELQGITGAPMNMLKEVTEIARDAVPDDHRRRMTPPKPEIVQRLTNINQQLPENQYYEPFTNQVAEYTMPAGYASRIGRQGEGATGNRYNQGAGPSGRPAQ